MGLVFRPVKLMPNKDNGQQKFLPAVTAPQRTATYLQWQMGHGLATRSSSATHAIDGSPIAFVS